MTACLLLHLKVRVRQTDEQSFSASTTVGLGLKIGLGVKVGVKVRGLTSKLLLHPQREAERVNNLTSGCAA